MAGKAKNSIEQDAVARADALRFAEVCLSYVSRGVHLEDGIGTLAEKRMHAILKNYVCSDVSCHEIRVLDTLPEQKRAAATNHKSTRYVSDVLRGSNVWEIQTGSFFPLREKIAWYMQHAPYHVTVVVPVPYKKHLNWIDTQTGTVQKRSVRPHTTKPTAVASELYWLREHLQNPKLSIELLLLEVEEYRLLDGYGKDKKARASKYEKIPTALCGTIVLEKAEDYRMFLPDDLPEQFTASQYAKASGQRGRNAYYALHMLVGAGLLTEGEKLGRAQSWVRISTDSL
ncbi:MAG: hypothetical protein IJW70_08675 [Clostridia bacterium]|nr:hypothetical protein [Clostridia bacterium]